MTEPLTPEELLGLPNIVDIPTAGRCYGLGRGTSYRLVREGRFPVPVLQLGARHVVVKAELLRSLQVDR